MTVSLTKCELFSIIVSLNEVIGSLDLTKEDDQKTADRLIALRTKCRQYMREQIK